MNKNQAHEILEQRKQGFAVPLYIVNRALVVSGDISMACSPCQATRVEGSGMAQGKGTGGLPYGSVEWANHRLNLNYEGKE